MVALRRRLHAVLPILALLVEVCLSRLDAILDRTTPSLFACLQCHRSHGTVLAPSAEPFGPAAPVALLCCGRPRAPIAGVPWPVSVARVPNTRRNYLVDRCRC